MYFLRRIFFFVPLLLLISFLAFVLVHLMPGGPFDRERKPASPEIERHSWPNTTWTNRSSNNTCATSTALSTAISGRR